MLQSTDPVCALVADQCSAAPSTDAAGQPLSTGVEEQQQPDGSWSVLNVDCSVAADAADPAQVTGDMARAEAQRLVPHPQIGIAPPGGRTLVNIQTILWLDTPTDRTLGTVTLLGHQVALRVHVRQVAWEFGDGSTAITAGPGKAYTDDDPCRSVLCPGYGGHVYPATGTKTITAQVTWTGEFQVDGGAWQPITGTVTGPAATETVTVRQARGVLVTPPGD